MKRGNKAYGYVGQCFSGRGQLVADPWEWNILSSAWLEHRASGGAAEAVRPQHLTRGANSLGKSVLRSPPVTGQYFSSAAKYERLVAPHLLGQPNTQPTYFQ